MIILCMVSAQRDDIILSWPASSTSCLTQGTNRSTAPYSNDSESDEKHASQLGCHTFRSLNQQSLSDIFSQLAASASTALWRYCHSLDVHGVATFFPK